LKANTEKSDRQIASKVGASPTKVGTVRKGLEKKGDVSKMDTSTDTKGRQQPRKRPRSKAAEEAAKKSEEAKPAPEH
jgi:hypothetical protein